MGHARRLFGAKSRGDMVQIELPSGRTLEAFFLGLGKFTNAFLVGRDTVYLYTQKEDRSKDILSLVSSFFNGSNPHLPKMSYLGAIDSGNGVCKVYKTKLYHTNVGKADMMQSVWAMRQRLQECHIHANLHTDSHDPLRPSRFNLSLVTEFCRMSTADHSMSQALIMLAKVCTLFGPNFMFDSFTRRNTAIDNKGHLILIDPMFDAFITRERLRKSQK